MNHVFSVTCVRSAQSLRASSQQPLLSAICLVRSRWYATTTTNNDDGAGSSSLTRAATTVRECKHPLIQGLKQTSVERQSLTSLAHNSPKSCFHSSAIYSKAKKSAKQPPKQPFQRWNVPGSSQLLSKTERPSSPQESVYKSRYRRQLPPYSGSLDLNPSGKPISYKSQEWTDCVENTTLDPLSKDEAGKIFGTVLDVDAAQEILQVLQYQRLSGTLDHAIAVPELPDILVANALEFLRERYPFDEDAAIMARIEREYDAEESEVADDDGKPAYVPQQDAEKTGIYGNSMIDENKAKLEQQEAEKAEKREEKGHEVGPPAKRLTFRERALAARQQESAEWVRKYKEKALLSDGPPPDMSVQQRLLPSAIFALITAACCLALATSYVSPPRAARLFPDTPPAAATVLTLIAINVAIFVAWGFPFAWRFMNTHFILVAGAPRTSSLLGNIFSHHGFTHLLSNVLGLWFIGTWCKSSYVNRVYIFADLNVKYMMTLDAETFSQRTSAAAFSLHSLPCPATFCEESSTSRH